MAEHYVTLFDGNFIVQGVAMQRSLARQDPAATLWVVCVDESCEDQLARLALPGVVAVPLREVENDALRAVRPGRTRAEYCWTLTPFMPQVVFERAPEARRATYVDADLYFLRAPAVLLDELDGAGKDVMITEHAYDPAWDQTESNGRFCVQFMPFRNSAGGRRVLEWWQARCVEWCFARAEPGRCGDQKYLDLWPSLFAAETHILQRPDLTLAPWNVDMFARRSDGRLEPVFYHFQGLRIVRPGTVRLHAGHRLGTASRSLYRRYLGELAEVLALLRQHGLPVPVLPEPAESLAWLRRLKRRLRGEVRYAALG